MAVARTRPSTLRRAPRPRPAGGDCRFGGRTLTGSVDLRAFAVGATVVAVGLCGEWCGAPMYLVAGLVLAMIATALALTSGVALARDELLWLAVLAWGCVGAVITSGDDFASKTTLGAWLGGWVLFVAASRLSAAGRDRLRAFLVTGAAILSLAVLAPLLGFPAAIANVNVAVAMIVPGAALAADAFSRKSIGRLVTAAFSVAVVLTQSRAGVLAVLVIVAAQFSPGRARRWAAAIAGVAGGGAIAWRLILHPSSLAWQRWRIWGAVLRSIAERPLWGIGAGDLGEAMGPYRLEHAAEVGRWGHIIGSAECTPLGLAARAGVPALILAAVAALLWLRGARSRRVTAAAALGAMALMAAFHDYCAEPAVIWWWAAVIGLVSARSGQTASGARGGWDWRRWPVAVAAAGVVTWCLVPPAWAEWAWNRGGVTVASARRAVALEPWFTTGYRRLAEKDVGRARWTWEEAIAAQDWSDRLVDGQPGSESAWRLAAEVETRIALQFGPFPATVARARNAFAQARILEPDLPWADYRQALFERDLGQLRRAQALVAVAVDHEPMFVRGWLLAARLDLDLGETGRARQALEKAQQARLTGESRVTISYHRDLLSCPEWQVQEIERDLESAEVDREP